VRQLQDRIRSVLTQAGIDHLVTRSPEGALPSIGVRREEWDRALHLYFALAAGKAVESAFRYRYVGSAEADASVELDRRVRDVLAERLPDTGSFEIPGTGSSVAPRRLLRPTAPPPRP
jgi:hypothetical protein